MRYDRRFMAKTVALYRLDNLIKSHSQDESVKAQKRAMRKAKRRRR